MLPAAPRKESMTVTARGRKVKRALGFVLYLKPVADAMQCGGGIEEPPCCKN